MSLLMDALRKAEEEKRRAALEKKGEAGAAGASAPDQLASTFPPEAPGPEVTTQTGEHTAENLRLEPMEGAAAEPEPASTTAPGSRTAAGSTTATGETAEPFGDTTRMRLTAAQRDVFDALGVPRRNEATGAFEGEQDFDATIPSKRMLKRSLEEYFEPTRSLEGARVASAPEQPAAPLEPDSGPITAQTVFSAKRRSRSGSAFSAAASLLLLAAAGLGAVGAYYWYTQSRSSQLVPPPAVAQRVEAIQTPAVEVPQVSAVPPAEAPGPAAAVEPATPTTTAATEPAAPIAAAEPAPVPPSEAVAAAEPTPEALTEPVTPAPEVPAAPAAPSAAAPLAEATPPAAPPVEQAPPAPPAAAPQAAAEPQPPLQTAMVEPPSTAEVERLQAPPAPAPKPKSELPAPKVSSAIDGSVMPGEIRIARARATQPFVPGQVQEAYDAYQRGDYGRAETLYRTALARYPGNRDALLGIAALSWRSGDKASAAGIYQRLLQANPNDATARSALLTLQKDKNPVVDESTVKLLLHREPESAQLRFVLGNIYARQQRWPEAQQAYFDAFTRDKTNPDVAYNLAVSLDNLGQHAAALDHYRKAVDLARQRPARFAASDAQSRIQALALASGSAP